MRLSAAHHIHRAAEVKPARFSCGPRYRGNVMDGVGYWVISKREITIVKGRTGPKCCRQR